MAKEQGTAEENDRSDGSGGNGLMMQAPDADPGLLDVSNAYNALGTGQGTMTAGPGGTLMYKPTGSAKPVDISGRTKEALDFFQSNAGGHWTQAQASGIVSNLIAESNLKDWLPGDGGAAYGIAQWHPDRQQEFFKKFGHNIQTATFKEQLEFVNYELTQGTSKLERDAGDALRGANNAYDAGQIVSKQYERPLLKDYEATARGRKAEGLMAGMDRENVRLASADPQTATDATQSNIDLLANPNLPPMPHRIPDIGLLKNGFRDDAHVQVPGRAGHGVHFNDPVASGPKPQSQQTASLSEEQQSLGTAANKSSGKLGTNSAGSAFNMTPGAKLKPDLFPAPTPPGVLS